MSFTQAENSQLQRQLLEQLALLGEGTQENAMLFEGRVGNRGCQVKCVTFSHLHPLPKQNHKLIEGRFPLGNRLGPLFGHVL
jgi:hypothetical protein